MEFKRQKLSLGEMNFEIIIYNYLNLQRILRSIYTGILLEIVKYIHNINFLWIHWVDIFSELYLEEISIGKLQLVYLMKSKTFFTLFSSTEQLQ